ncbi:MAG: four helix bundle protein [Candidatus Solibacter usitatus]|nr:four helix bundle protein [Candidatus Solibacter usitatus]
MQDFKNLKVWQKGHRLTLALYDATRSFPKEELFGLTSQIRRAAASIPANIAEGCGRGGKRELNRFLLVAMGSASELEYHLLLASDLRLLKAAPYQSLAQDVIELKRMLTALIRTVSATTEN